MKKILLVLAIVFSSSLNASPFWRVTLNVLPRPPQQINQWRTIPNIVALRITYTGSERVRVYLNATLTQTRHGVILQGRSRVLEFSPGQTIFVTNTELVDWSSVTYSSSMAERIRRTGNIPEGEYTVCVDVIPASGGPSLAHTCATFLIVAPSPPQLVHPEDQDSVMLFGLVFRWTPVTVPAGVSVRYRIKIWELFPGEDFNMATSRRPVLSEVTLATNFIYSRRYTALHVNHTYIWQVQAVDMRGNPIGENNGKSEIRKFTVIPRFHMIVLLPNYLKIGNFLVRVSSYSTGSSLSSLSGNGSSFFRDESSGSRVWFNLTFSHLHSDSSLGDTAFIDTGQITVTPGHPIVFSRAGMKLHVTQVMLWPDSAKATLFVTHPCLNDTGSPDFWQLGPFTTSIDTLGGFYKIISGSSVAPFRLNTYDIFIKPVGDITIKTFSGGGTAPHGGGGPLPPHGFKPPGGHIFIPPALFAWTGIKFDSGYTINRNALLVSNTGFLYGRYTFSNATLSDSGLSVELHLSQPMSFRTVAPYGFSIKPRTGTLKITRCRVDSGNFTGRIRVPAGENGIIVSYATDSLEVMSHDITIDSNLTLTATGSIIKTRIYWGQFVLIHEGEVKFRFTAPPRRYFSLISGDSLINPSSAALDTFVGMVIKPGGRHRDTLGIISPDLKGRSAKIPCGNLRAWLVLDEQGVTANFELRESMTVLRKKMGRKGESGYLASEYFDVEIKGSPKDTSRFYIRFTGNAVFDARMDGKIKKVPRPSSIEFPFIKMGITSLGYIVGGEVRFSTPQELDYWGVKITSRSGYVSAHLGEVVFTDADISENRHFSRPFNLQWGEFLADGRIGKLYFNKNSAFQKFDGFPITLDSAALSRYDSTNSGPRYGALVVRSQVHFKFFGEADTAITIFDHKFDSTSNPYYGRFVYIKDPETFGLKREWGHSTATFDFDTVYYDTINQYAFQGTGKIEGVWYLNGSDAKASVKIDSAYSAICVTETSNKGVGTTYMDLANVKDLWGCAYIEGDSLKRLVIGGMVSPSVNGFFTTRTGLAARMTLSITPTISKFTVQGKFIFKHIAGIEVEAYAKFTNNRQEHWFEGDIEGLFNLGGGIPLAFTSNASAKGHFTFRAGGTYSFIQGDAEIKFGFSMGLSGAGMGISGGFFMGVNVPKERAWVLKNKTGRFGVDMRNLPATLTGFYAYLDRQYSLDLGIFSGEMELFFGLGAMVNGPPGASACGVPLLPYVIGDFGIYLGGKILWGVVSASGSAEAEFLGPCPFAISGSLTLRGCVIELLCASVDLNFGISSTRGFYLE